MGYLLVFLSLLSFGLLGICHKYSERKQCRPQPLSTMLQLFAFLGMNLIVLFHGGYATPPRVVIIALIFGALSGLGLWTFQVGFRYGKISTSWLLINLSSAIPTAASILIYKEPVNLKKILILCMVAVAIYLVWLDRKEDLEKEAVASEEVPAESPIVVGSVKERGND
jgi:drug/metabolite transporter (DMT)-like permease